MVASPVELSRHANAPVKLFLEREEEQIDAGNRPGTWQRLRIGAKRDGTLTAISLESYGTAGVGLGAGVGNNAEDTLLLPQLSKAPSTMCLSMRVRAAPCALPAIRPADSRWSKQSTSLPKIWVLIRSTLRDRVDPSPVRREERRIGAERIGWQRRHAAWRRSGRGETRSRRRTIVMGCQCPDQRILRSSHHARRLRRGVIERAGYRHGHYDCPCPNRRGGTRAAAPIRSPFASATLNIRLAAAVIRQSHDRVGHTASTHGGMARAAELFAEAALALNAGVEQLVMRDGNIVVRDDPARRIAFRDAAARLRTDRISAVASRSDDYAGFRRRMPNAALAQQDLGGVQFAEVTVDTETGIVRVERVVAVQDCGRPMNPRQIESQIHGGVLMGLSYALFENRILDQATGRMVNPNLEQYKVAGPRETPQIDVVVLENYQGQSATDAYGIAEPANIATAPAIANAIYNAIGVRMRELPITPAKVLAALGKVPLRS